MKADEILRRARFWGLTIATAESCTGGMIAAALTDVAGSSDVFDRGFVTYSNAAKIEMLGVRAETLAAHGAVSEPVAREMAEGALAASGAGLAVAVTGIAGPGGSERKPEGRVCFALARQGTPTWAETVEFGAPGRAKVRKAATAHGLALLGAALE
ncbi:MAG: CinA family protein [Rhodobacter sp.]|nr:CinA family protein [Rhodobacter sp.]